MQFAFYILPTQVMNEILYWWIFFLLFSSFNNCQQSIEFHICIRIYRTKSMFTLPMTAIGHRCRCCQHHHWETTNKWPIAYINCPMFDRTNWTDVNGERERKKVAKCWDICQWHSGIYAMWTLSKIVDGNVTKPGSHPLYVCYGFFVLYITQNEDFQ